MSLRKIAKELGITPAYLSYMVNGKRRWRPDLYQRYVYLVNTFVNGQANSVNSIQSDPPMNDGAKDRIRTYDLALMKRPLCR